MRGLITTIALTVAVALASGGATADELQDKARKLAQSEIKAITQNPAVVAAVKAQNAKHAGLKQGDIDALDKKWRAERKSATSPMIDAVAKAPVSGELTKFKESGQGLYTEVFVMDDKGLNVGMSDPTSDYWQGDEAKWQKTFLAGADAIHLSEVEKDDSTNTFQMQISMTVVDGGKPIGAITVGVDAEMLQAR